MTLPPLLEEGLNLFNDEKYYEAHEVWEDLWRETPLEKDAERDIDKNGSLRQFYQGLIQAAVGMYHLRRANTLGARSQFVKSIRNLTGAANCEHGLNAEALIAQLTSIQEEMKPQPLRIARLK